MDLTQIIIILVSGGIFIKCVSKIYKKPITTEEKRSNNLCARKLEKVNSIDTEVINEVINKVCDFSISIDVSLQKPVLNERKYDIGQVKDMLEQYNKNSILALKKETDVPTWKNYHVLSHNDIKEASLEQKTFYNKFKKKFIDSEPISIDGNTNYAFVLMYDLFNNYYQNHKDINILTDQFNFLAENYPETQKYVESLLTQSRKSYYINRFKNLNRDHEDDSIIDITGEDQNIRFDDTYNKENNDLKSFSKIIQRSDEIKKEVFSKQSKIKVPHWGHQYVYSHEEIHDASNEQKAFYKEFKKRFLNGEYIDLEGNSNYCFILLYDLFNDYQSHKDLIKLENQFINLGRNYPKTATYAKSLLQRQNRANNPYLDIQNTAYEYQDYRLGARYKKQLNLSSAEVDYLDKIWNTNNNFLNIEFCLIEAAKLYIAVISELKNAYAKEGKTIEEKFLEIGDLIATKHHKYRKGSQNYKHAVDYSINYIVFNNIFKHCESTLRQCYGHNRNVDPRLSYKEEIIQTEYELKVASKVKEILNTLSSKISEPNDDAEIALNLQSVNRWKDKFSHIKETYGNNLPKFIESVSALERLNQKTPSLKNLLLEISKFLSKHNKELSLTYYTKYLYYAADSKGIDDKKFVQSLHKSLFKTAEQFTDFQKIINDLIKDRDLDKALNATSKFYEIKRKKIELNKSSIQEAKQQHSETVILLSEYLKEDDSEDAVSQVIQKESPKEEVAAQDNTSIFRMPFNPTQIALASLFEKNNFSVSRNDLEAFARSNNVFESRIIDSINEVCYDLLDDVLIEEEGDFYIINESNFNKILQK